MSVITLAAIQDEARELGLRASVEFPGYVEVTDPIGRLILIGTGTDSDDPAIYTAQVHATRARWAAGESPRESDRLDTTNVRVLVAHALQVANRVPVTSADRAYATDAEQRKADRDEQRARNGRRR